MNLPEPMKLLERPIPSIEEVLDADFSSDAIRCSLTVSIESFFALRKLVAQRGWVWHTLSMANQPAPDKKHLTLRMPRVLHKRLKKLAKIRGESLTEVVLSILHKSADNVELTADEFRQIADEIEKARRKS